MERVTDSELRDFLTSVIEVLERLGIPYMVVGGFAAIVHGEPRLTIDVDIVADLQRHQVRGLVAAFPPPEYYVSEEAIYDSLDRGYPFNILQSATGAKVDVVPLPVDPLTRNAFQRRRREVYDEAGQSAMFITPEDLVIVKLVAFQETQSDKHLRDARGVLITLWGQLDLEFIRAQAHSLGMSDLLENLLEVARREVEE